MHHSKKISSAIIGIVILLVTLVYAFELDFQVIFSDPPLDTLTDNVRFYSLILASVFMVAMSILLLFSQHHSVFMAEIILAAGGIILAITSWIDLFSFINCLYFVLVLLFAFYEFNHYRFKSHH